MTTYTVFAGSVRLGSGSLLDASRLVARAGAAVSTLVFNDETGHVIDLDARGDDAALVARYGAAPEAVESDAAASVGDGSGGATGPRGPGRPRLGVVAREVTLLPGQWDWLSAQPGGASVTLRKIVEQAKRAGATEERARRAREAAYRFLYAVAGDFPGFEEVSRALFAGDAGRMRREMAGWPVDIAAHALVLLGAGPESATTAGM